MLGINVKSDVNMAEKSKVRRCLFGPPDHESIQKDLSKALQDNISEMRSVWNFDFKTERPLEGRYKWELIEDTDNIPEFYRKGYAPRKTIRRIHREKCKPSIESDNDSDSLGNVQHVCDSSEMDILAKPLDFSSSDEEDLSSQNNTDMCNKDSDSQNSNGCSNKSGKVLVQRQIGDFMKKRKKIIGASSLSSKSKLRRLDF